MNNSTSSIVNNELGQPYFIGSSLTEIGSTRIYVSEEMLRAVVYRGSKKTAIKNLNFRSLEDLKQWFADETCALKKKFDSKMKYSTYTHRMHVGSILMARVEHTVKFFQVTKAETPKMVHVREIESYMDEKGEFCIPRVGMFTANSVETSKRVLSSTSVKIKNETEGFLMEDFRVIEFTGSKIYTAVPVLV